MLRREGYDGPLAMLRGGPIPILGSRFG